MGKKNKKEKGRGVEKAAAKLTKRDKKEEGMEDLEALIAQFQENDRKKNTFNEEKSSHPSPRTNLTVTAHPEKDELILFGGEYFNGQKTYLYNDIFVYNIKKNEWTQQNIPNPPPPRCAHQTVAVQKEGGQLWVFGGEFASPTNLQFYHYKDLWVLNLKEHKWTQVKASGGPSQRSGHRMTVYKKNLFLFGGFHESHRNFVYFNDCYLFSLTDYKWTKLATSGTAPSPRSACQLTVTPSGILVVGGYSKVRVKKEIEKGTAHTDMYLLTDENGKWKWTRVKDSGNRPWPRSSFSFSQMAPNRAVLFGGVSDEEDEEDLESFFHNSMSCLDLVSFRWFPMDLRKNKVPKKNKVEGDDEKSEETAEVEDMEEEATPGPVSTYILPCARMNALAAVKKNVLYLYGGMFEEDSKQVALNDLWSINLKKMDTWVQLVEADDTSTDWFEDDVENSCDEEESMDEEESKPSTSATSLPCHPDVESNEDVDSYFKRTREHWLEVASDDADEEVRANVIHDAAEKLAISFYDKCSIQT